MQQLQLTYLPEAAAEEAQDPFSHFLLYFAKADCTELHSKILPALLCAVFYIAMLHIFIAFFYTEDLFWLFNKLFSNCLIKEKSLIIV